MVNIFSLHLLSFVNNVNSCTNVTITLLFVTLNLTNLGKLNIT